MQKRLFSAQEGTIIYTMLAVPHPRRHYNEFSMNQLGGEEEWFQQMAKWIMSCNRSSRKKVSIETLIALGVTYQELLATGYTEGEVRNGMLLLMGRTLDTADLKVSPCFTTAASKSFQTALQYNASYQPPGTLTETKLDQKQNQPKRQKTNQSMPDLEGIYPKLFQATIDKKESVSVLYVISYAALYHAKIGPNDEIWNLIEARLDTDCHFGKDVLQNIDLFNGLELNLGKANIITRPITPSSVAAIAIQLAIMLEFEQSLSTKFGTDVQVHFTTEDTLLQCVEKNPAITAHHISENFNCFVYPDLRHLCCPTRKQQPTTRAETFFSFVVTELMMKHQTRLYPLPSLVHDSLNNYFQYLTFSDIGRPYLPVNLRVFDDFKSMATRIKRSLLFKYSNTQRSEIRPIVSELHLTKYGIVGMPSLGNKHTYIRIQYNPGCDEEVSVTNLVTGESISDLQTYKKTIGGHDKYIFAPFIPNMDQNNCSFVFLIQKKSQLSRMYTIHLISPEASPEIKDWNRNQGGFGDKQLQEDVKQSILSLVRSKVNWEQLAQKTCINVKMIPLGNTFIVKHARIVHPNTTFLTTDQLGDVDGERNSLTRKKFWEYYADIMAQYFDGKWRQWYSV
jgi:hypothetical protein